MDASAPRLPAPFATPYRGQQHTWYPNESEVIMKATAAVLVSALGFFAPGLAGAESAAAAECTIEGTTESDVLRGTPRADFICAYGGADIIRGLGGNDLILAGRGNDRVEGGRGADRIRGGLGADRLLGQQENDILRGESGRDRADGGYGGDRLFGGGDHDRLWGGPARDLFYVRDGRRDRVSGDLGRDCARADRNVDVLLSVHEVF
jgi:Ca2+-binding RTX toxin-like protein